MILVFNLLFKEPEEWSGEDVDELRTMLQDYAKNKASEFVG